MINCTNYISVNTLAMKNTGGFPDSSGGKESTCNAGDPWFDSWVGKICWRREKVTHSSILAWRINPWGRQESDWTEQFSQFSHSLSIISILHWHLLACTEITLEVGTFEQTTVAKSHLL